MHARSISVKTSVSGFDVTTILVLGHEIINCYNY